MANPYDLVTDFSCGQTIDPKVAYQAAKAVVDHSQGIDDALLLLDMLGLVNPQPGNEPTKLTATKQKLNLISRRERSRKAKLESMGVTPEEIGDVE